MPTLGRKRPRAHTGAGANENEDDYGNGADMSLVERDAEDGHSDDDGDESRRKRQAGWQLPPNYGDRNRAFLQAFLAHGALTFRHVQHLLAAIFNAERNQQNSGDDDEASQADDPIRPDEISMDDLREFVDKARFVLAPLDFDIRSAADQKSGERVWTLVSTDRDPKSHLAVLLTPRKLAFVHRLISAIFETYNTPRIEALCFTAQQALKLSRPPRPAAARPSDAGSSAATNRDKGLKHSVVLGLLKSLVVQGWLDLSAAGFYTLSTRALLELQPFLAETYNDNDDGEGGWQRIKFCAACKDLVTVGLRCSATTCSLRLHEHCETAYWRTQARAAGGNRACPHCQTPWRTGNEEDAEAAKTCVGERAIILTDVYKRKKRQGRPSEGVDELMRAVLPRTVAAAVMPVRGGQRQRASQAESLLEEEEEEEEGEEEGEEEEGEEEEGEEEAEEEEE